MTYPLRARWGLAALVLCGFNAVAQPATAPPPLAPLAYRELALGAIQPAGWLRTQLGIMRDHSTGHLDEIYPKLRDKNGWLGGTGDGWEETPYWLDGAVPLAHLLQDKPLLAKVQRYVDWSIQHQRPSGYFGLLTKTEQAAGKTVGGRRLPAWQLDEGVAPQPVTPRYAPRWPVDPTLETLTFIPYGCTKLRVVALPIIP